jgi:hypothetical protein
MSPDRGITKVRPPRGDRRRSNDVGVLGEARCNGPLRVRARRPVRAAQRPGADRLGRPWSATISASNRRRGLLRAVRSPPARNLRSASGGCDRVSLALSGRTARWRLAVIVRASVGVVRPPALPARAGAHAPSPKGYHRPGRAGASLDSVPRPPRLGGRPSTPLVVRRRAFAAAAVLALPARARRRVEDARGAHSRRGWETSQA